VWISPAATLKQFLALGRVLWVSLVPCHVVLGGAFLVQRRRPRDLLPTRGFSRGIVGLLPLGNRRGRGFSMLSPAIAAATTIGCRRSPKGATEFEFARTWLPRLIGLSSRFVFVGWALGSRAPYPPDRSQRRFRTDVCGFRANVCSR